MDTTKRLFVSHSHADDPFCLRLIADLRANLGEEAVWFDTSGGLHGGDAWWDRIVAEITERPYFLVVLSPNASVSKWVPQEMAIAFRQHVELGKRLLPVRLADSPRREDWRGIQEFDFTHNDDPTRYAAALTEVLHAIDENAPQPVVSPSPISTVVNAPDRPLSVTERLAQEAHAAYGHEHWTDVLDKTEILVERDAMSPALWRERASAAFALGDNNGGLAVIKQALQTSVDDAGTLLLYVRLTTKAGDDKQTVEILTRAYALVSSSDTVTRLAILNELLPTLSRLGRWDEFARRVNDARRIAPDDPRWALADLRLALREVEALLKAQRYDESVAAVRTLPAPPAGMDITLVIPYWRSAISSAAMGLPEGKNWYTYHALLDAAAAAGVDASTIAHWRFEFPHFVPLITVSSQNDYYSVPSGAWSPPNGTRLAVASRGGLQVLDTASGRMLGSLSGLSEYLGVVEWSPDGTRLAFGRAVAGRACRIWDVASGQALAILDSRPVSGIWRVLGIPVTNSNQDTTMDVEAWSPNGAWLATTSYGGDALAQVWDVASGRLLATLPGHIYSYGTTSVAWSPNGALLAVTNSTLGTNVLIWNVPNGGV